MSQSSTTGGFTPDPNYELTALPKLADPFAGFRGRDPENERDEWRGRNGEQTHAGTDYYGMGDRRHISLCNQPGHPGKLSLAVST